MSNVRAPIDPDLLRSVLAPTLGASRTLPADAYLSEEVFAWEQEHLFEGGWVCVGRADDLSEPGDQKAVQIGDEGVLLVRDGDGRLNGVRQHLPPPRPRAAGAGRHDQPAGDQVPVPRVGLRSGR